MSRRHELVIPRTASGAAAVVCMAMVALSGCTGPQALPAGTAAAHYEQVRLEVVDVLSTDRLDLTVREEPVVGSANGTCVYDPGSWEADGEFVAADESAWRPLIDPLNEVLDRHGFEEVDEFDHTNGEAFGISVVDRHGLRLRAYSLEGSTVISLHGAVIDGADGCTADALGI